MEEKAKIKIKIKHRSRIGRPSNSNFLQQKRALPYFKVKNKSKVKNWKKQMEKLEESLDLDIIKENFRHFFHLNFEDNIFDKELSSLEHLFTPINFWLLIDDSYFQKCTIKERINNLLKEFSKNNNYNSNILILDDEDNDNTDCINNSYQNRYKYNTILSDTQESKIKSNFFANAKSILSYLKNKDKDINNDIKNKENINNNDSLENDKERINNLIKIFHEENDKKLKSLKELVNENILKNEGKEDICEKSEEKNNNKCNNYIRINPFFDQDNKSLYICNRFIEYIQKKEKIKTQTFEHNKKIFSFSEKFMNSKNNNSFDINSKNINNNIYTNETINKDSINDINNYINLNIDNIQLNSYNEFIKKEKIKNNDNSIEINNNNIINNENNNINNYYRNTNSNEIYENYKIYKDIKIEYKIAYINNYLVNKEENNFFINQGICCICNNGDVEMNQFLLRCEQCNVTVHQNCYGAQVKELYNWTCDACKEMSKEEVYNLECFLCPVRGGAFKKIELPVESTFYKNVMDYKHNKISLPPTNYNIIIPKKDYKKIQFAWAHLSCALWNPNINLKNYEKKSGIYIENITYDNFNSYCNLCKKDNCGPTIKCNNDNCDYYYHPECARINNCCLEVEIINKEYQYNVYCYKHKPNLLAKKINNNCHDEIQQIINVNNELTSIYELYKKVYKNDLFLKPKIINKIEIEDYSHNNKIKRHKIYAQNNYSSTVMIKKLKKIKQFKNLENIVINLSKRGRKRKYIINNYINNNKNNNSNKKNLKNLNNIIINTNTKTIINNMGSGNNINIYVNNYNNCNNLSNFKINKSKSEKKSNKDLNINNFPSPTIEINKKEFDKFSSNKILDFEVEKYIDDKNEFFIYLIGFLNDYLLKNRIILKKNNEKKNYTIYRQAPIYFLKYEDFKNGNIPWGEIGYKNLTSNILRKSFFTIIYDEKQFKKLFLDKIPKTLKELKKNKRFEKYQVECDNKEKCIGAPNGIYYLKSLDSFKYKILDEKHFFPKTFLCPSCLNNIPNINNSTKNKNKKDSNNINIDIKRSN